MVVLIVNCYLPAEGINETKTKYIPLTIVYKKKDAIVHACENAKPGSLVTIMCDVVAEALYLIKGFKEKEDAEVLPAG